MKRLIILIVLLSSCSTKSSLQEEHFVGQYSRQLFIQKDSLDLGWKFQGKLPIEALPDMKPGQVVIIKDTSETGELRGQVRLMIDEMGNLQIHCEEQSKLIANLRRQLINKEELLLKSKTEKSLTSPWRNRYTLITALIGIIAGAFMFRSVR